MTRRPAKDTMLLSELAERWAPELDRSGTTVLVALAKAAHPLRYDSVFVTSVTEGVKGNLGKHEVTQEFARHCAVKYGWDLPAFWFGTGEPRQKGRPTNRELVLREYQARTAAGEREETIRAEARAIHRSLKKNAPEQKIPGQGPLKRIFASSTTKRINSD
jgi:hypothetical protein